MKTSSSSEAGKMLERADGGLFCIPIMAKDTDEAVKKMGDAKHLADLMEIRLDLMESFDVPSLVRASPAPVLVTYRSRAEGGKGDAHPDRVCLYLGAAARAGAAYVDLELNLPAEVRKEVLKIKEGSKYIISRHIPEETPSDYALRRIMKDASRVGGHAVKIVPMARLWEDNLRIISLIIEARRLSIPIIAFCMGPIGRISRIFAHIMGNYLTFASLDEGEESAKGQIPIIRMKETLRYLGYVC
ncbi:type I 3-dehydroquinate dehydratase [bacterium]|nr:type I 3-dehydroquinate dehydratase [bacterium]OIP38550.1 MAG: hypothetical protein AUK25_12460 [Desulfobacteraceae bacterium CG2_30_51_40]